MQVVKLGGSVITDKRRRPRGGRSPPRFLSGTARRLLREVRDSRQEVVLVTGAGSFGHELADRYGLKEGLREDGQWDGYVKVHRDVRRLNLLVLDEAVRLGMRVVSVPPSVSAIQAGGSLHYLDEGVFRRYVSAGITPVTFGDVALDLQRGFSICGGDSLVRRLAELFGAERAVFVSDVDGILVGERGVLAREFTGEDLPRITPRRDVGGKDVTGGIRAKALSCLEMASAGTESWVVNGRRKGRLLLALKGGRPVGTHFRRL